MREKVIRAVWPGIILFGDNVTLALTGDGVGVGLGVGVGVG